MMPVKVRHVNQCPEDLPIVYQMHSPYWQGEVAFPRFDSTLKLTAKAAATKAEDENNVFSMAMTKDKNNQVDFDSGRGRSYLIVRFSS
jgi:hypothetical protein